MGREIRRVPEGWEHPKDGAGRYLPMFKDYFNDVQEEWQINNRLWEGGKHLGQKDYPEDTRNYTYEQWHGLAPDPKYYNPYKWSNSEASCFQVYETITEGIPVSPVFGTLREIATWMVEKQNYSPEAAAELCEMGWMPTFTGVIKSNSGLPGIGDSQTKDLKRPTASLPSKQKRRKPGKL